MPNPRSGTNSQVECAADMITSSRHTMFCVAHGAFGWLLNRFINCAELFCALVLSSNQQNTYRNALIVFYLSQLI
eukprot:scaffold674331_cov104-Prasinocladus_malaysianus.AAC.1